MHLTQRSRAVGVTLAATAAIGVATAVAFGAGTSLGAPAKVATSFVRTADRSGGGPGEAGGPGLPPAPGPFSGSGPSSAAGVESPAGVSSSAPSGGAYAFAPYVDTAQRQDLGAVAREAGTRYLSAAFVVSSGGCSPAWNGTDGVDGTAGPDDAAFTANLSAGLADLRADGGDAIASFGGADGTELALTCPDVAELAAAYRTVIDGYGFTHVDFDIEGAAADDPASIDRRSRALALLQAGYAARGKTLTVSLTLPVLPSGLTREGLAVVADAVRDGLKLGVVNVMTMDYGDWAAPAPSGRMGGYAEQAAEALHGQLRTLYPDLTDAQLWAMVGITPMIGVNDARNEVFGLADARTVASFAALHHIGRLAMWSLTRDEQCPGGAQTSASATCSSVDQAPHAFSDAFEAFTG